VVITNLPSKTAATWSGLAVPYLGKGIIWRNEIKDKGQRIKDKGKRQK
jgi:hypothetical protein